jgi:TonB family protein
MTLPAFGRYKIVEEIGRGAMGVVYRATDPVIGRAVAIKVINEGYLTSVGVTPSEYFERFQREAEVAGRLNHPGIAKIYDLGPNFIVMEYIDGQNLATQIRASTRQRLSEVLDTVGQIAAALDHAHANGVIHRDVKPANILLRPDGMVKVMDFGLARIDSSTLTAAGEILGSASYMAPEIVRGQPATAQSDVFSLGVVAYELLTGDRPFAGGSISAIIHSLIQSTPRPIHGVNLNLPPEYDDIFAKVLAKEPAKRYSTAGEFSRDLVQKKWSDRDPTLVEPLAEVSPDSTTQRDGARIREAALAAARAEPTEAPGPVEATIILGKPVEDQPPPPAARRGRGLLWGSLGCAAVLLLGLLGAMGLLALRFRGGPAPEPVQSPESAPPSAPAAPPSLGPVTEPSAPPEALVAPLSPRGPARLSVTSDPDGARVFIDGRPRGTTPASIELEPGVASVAVDKAGFRTWRREVTLAPGADETLRADLEPRPRPTTTPSPSPPPRPSTHVGDLVALTPDVTPPKRLSGGSPELPRSVSGLKSATVLIEFTVTEDGQVDGLTVVESAGPALDKACLEAVAKWRYSPATKDGVRVRVHQRASFRFELR